MSRETVVATVESCGIECAYAAFPVGTAPPLPWAVFTTSDDDPLMADGERWCGVTRWEVELYQEQSDAELERSLERAIEEAFGPWKKRETWVDSEDCLMTAYTFTDIERGA